MRKLFILISFFLMVESVIAQSLKPEAPYPLQAGINKGTSDSLVGTQYWFFYATPGNSRLTVRFKQPTTLYGAQPKTTLTISLSDDKKLGATQKLLPQTKTHQRQPSRQTKWIKR